MDNFFDSVEKATTFFKSFYTGKEGKEGKEGFGNLFDEVHFNESCMIITMLFLIILIYKEELMKTKLIKDLVK